MDHLPIWRYTSAYAMIFIYNKKDFASGFCLFAIGLFLALQSKRLSIWSRVGPEEGFFPLIVGLIIMSLSLLLIMMTLGITQKQEKKRILEGMEKNAANKMRLFSYTILMLAYAILIEYFGFLITSTLFLIPVLKYAEKQSWKLTIVVGFASIIISYLVFKYLLGVPLPLGIMIW